MLVIVQSFENGYRRYIRKVRTILREGIIKKNLVKLERKALIIEETKERSYDEESID